MLFQLSRVWNFRKSLSARLGWGIAAIVVLSPSFGFATLGESLDQKARLKEEQVKLQATDFKTTPSALYTVNATTVGLNSIREYTRADGVVFAVTWTGPSHPDLEALFGSYYSEYQAADEARVKGMGQMGQKGHSGVAFKTARIAIRRGGHMRALRGSAVVSSLVPNGVNAEELP